MNNAAWSMAIVLMVIVLLLAACGAEPDSQSQGGNAAVAGSGGGNETVVASPAISGEEIYGNYCFSCHSPGLNGAPKLGDVEGWAPRIAKGTALMVQTTIAGIPPAMPPRGLCMSCSDEEIKAVVEYMVESSQ